MIVDDKLLAKLENLTMIKIAEDEKERFKEELNEFLEFTKVLDGIDISSVDISSLPLDIPTDLRDDVVVDSSEVIGSIINHAPKTESGCFIVPRVVN